MNIRPIKTEADYQTILKEIDGLVMAEADTPEGDRLSVLLTLVEAYEQAHYPIDFPDPMEAAKFRMEQQELTEADRRYRAFLSGQETAVAAEEVFKELRADNQ